MTAKTIKLKLVKSVIGTRKSHRATISCLKLGRLNSVSEVLDTPEARGRIKKVSYLVQVIG